MSERGRSTSFKVCVKCRAEVEVHNRATWHRPFRECGGRLVSRWANSSD